MSNHNRMSPATALFLGLFGVGAVGIASGTGIVLYAMRIIDSKASSILGLAQDTISGLPELVESLPPAVGELLSDHRDPTYASNVDVNVRFVRSDRPGTLRPVMTITNKGSEVISMLAVRVAALDDNGVPIREWTEVVATPLAIDDDWRGPLFPGKTRHVVLSSRRVYASHTAATLTGAVEISELRIWKPSEES